MLDSPFHTTSLQDLFCLFLHWGPLLHTPYISSPNHHLFATHACAIAACFANVMSSIPNLSLSSLLGNLSYTLMPHIHLTILISGSWSATSYSFLTGQVSLPCSILFRTQLVYNFPLIINDTLLLVSSGTNCLNLFQPIQSLASTAAL